MRGFCCTCGRQLFWEYGDGDRECSGCRERREEQADVIAWDRAVVVGYQPRQEAVLDLQHAKADELSQWVEGVERFIEDLRQRDELPGHEERLE